jgi:hypothetical protein
MGSLSAKLSEQLSEKLSWALGSVPLTARRWAKGSVLQSVGSVLAMALGLVLLLVPALVPTWARPKP